MAGTLAAPVKRPPPSKGAQEKIIGDRGGFPPSGGKTAKPGEMPPPKGAPEAGGTTEMKAATQGGPPPAMGGSGGAPDPALLAAFGKAAGPGMPPPDGKPMLNPAEMGALGRNGDSTVAHLTPGEITIPPELQSPGLMALLSELFQQKGVSIDQFTVGSPDAPRNPATGMEEHNFLSSILPAALGIGGSLIGGPMLGYGLGGAAIGAGLGTAAGNLATGASPAQSLIGGLGAGLGSAVAGGALGSLTGGAAPVGASPSPMGGPMPGLGAGVAGAPVGGVSATPSLWSGGPGVWDTLMSKQTLGAVGGGMLGSTLAAPEPTTGAAEKAMGKGMGALNKDYNSILGNNGTATAPNFNGYDPNQIAYGRGYRFFPQA